MRKRLGLSRLECLFVSATYLLGAILCSLLSLLLGLGYLFKEVVVDNWPTPYPTATPFTYTPDGFLWLSTLTGCDFSYPSTSPPFAEYMNNYNRLDCISGFPADEYSFEAFEINPSQVPQLWDSFATMEGGNVYVSQENYARSDILQVTIDYPVEWWQPQKAQNYSSWVVSGQKICSRRVMIDETEANPFKVYVYMVCM